MHEIRIPRLGWSMEEGLFVGWLKPPGSSIAAGEPLFEMEGEKALQEVEAVDGGTLYVLHSAPAAGSVVPVGTLLGYLLSPGETPPADSPKNVSPPQEAAPAIPAIPPPAGPAARRKARELGVKLEAVAGSGAAGKITLADITASVPNPIASSVKQESAVATPRARRVARELGVDWQQLSGTGREGRIREADVRLAASRPQSSPPRLALTGSRLLRRKAIAERLRHSLNQTVPVTLTTTADVTHLVALREQFKTAKSAVVPAYTDLVACLVAQVLLDHPQMAVVWNAADHTLRQVVPEELHIGIAVDTPEGLLVPVVRDVSRKSLLAVAHESRELIEQARQGRLAARQMDGGVFTITNLGAYGIEYFTPIINYPQIAILGLGAIRKEAVVSADERIVARNRMGLSLTFDHAAIDGAPAAAFLKDLVQRMESPAAHLLTRT